MCEGVRGWFLLGPLFCVVTLTAGGNIGVSLAVKLLRLAKSWAGVENISHLARLSDNLSDQCACFLILCLSG